VALSGATANLAVSLIAFGAAAWALDAGTPQGTDGTSVISFATTHAGVWFWAVPGAIIELLTTGSALELRQGIQALVQLVTARPLLSFPYLLGALSALWAALNLIPVPVLETDGWHVARALLRRPAR
jgi:Zn-dependent protease